MDPVRKIEQLNYQDWQREEAEADKESIGDQIFGWLLILGMCGVIVFLALRAWELGA